MTEAPNYILMDMFEKTWEPFETYNECLEHIEECWAQCQVDEPDITRAEFDEDWFIYARVEGKVN